MNSKDLSISEKVEAVCQYCHHRQMVPADKAYRGEISPNTFCDKCGSVGYLFKDLTIESNKE